MKAIVCLVALLAFSNAISLPATEQEEEFMRLLNKTIVALWGGFEDGLYRSKVDVPAECFGEWAVDVEMDILDAINKLEGVEAIFQLIRIYEGVQKLVIKDYTYCEVDQFAEKMYGHCWTEDKCGLIKLV